MGSSYKEFKAAQKKTKFEYGVILGLSNSQIKRVSNNIDFLDDSYTSIDPTFGIVAAISSPRFNEKMAFQSEIHFNKSSFSSQVETKGLSSRTFHETQVDLSTISIPFSMRFNFPKQSFDFFIQVGAHTELYLESRTKKISELILSREVLIQPKTSAFDVSSGSFGFWGGIGVLKTFNPVLAGVSIRYFNSPNLSSEFGINLNRITLNLIIFKK